MVPKGLLRSFVCRADIYDDVVIMCHKSHKNSHRSSKNELEPAFSFSEVATKMGGPSYGV